MICRSGLSGVMRMISVSLSFLVSGVDGEGKGNGERERERRKANKRAAIWDNRSVFHTATFDYEGQGERFGNRAVGLGERPYLDPQSSTRREALAAAGELL